MKKTNRIVSALLLFCFVVNTAISDLAFSQTIDIQSKNSDKLAPPLATDDIVGIQHEEIVGLEM
ncbi:MAG: hypothetical protein Q7S30_03145, partial [Candidatus Omnitrophota bacterium]|nr:hypothetical protein [Candidatus Omnitrophota bacterium]